MQSMLSIMKETVGYHLGHVLRHALLIKGISSMKLNYDALTSEQQHLYNEVKQAPIKVLQIGEGNFLRGFVDWMLHESRKQGLFNGSVVVVQPRPSGKPKIEALADQAGLYTLVTRGLESGAAVERQDVISVFSQVFDPYENWERFLALAIEPELSFVISNTTEAGLAYREEAWEEGVPIQSYPGKLTALLYRRYVAFEGAGDKGLICLPCELLERNGDTLLDCVLRYSQAWNLPQDFINWVKEHNIFLNSLVDRIVTGYPGDEQAEKWFAEWGYSDPLLTTAEPYHLWAIEGSEELEEKLPLAKAGLNVLWVDALKPYQQRKVRILNGAHTFIALLGILKGFAEVRLTMEDAELGKLIRTSIATEIIPSLPDDQEKLTIYAEEVIQRFLNPFIQHRLSDISMNSLSKFKTRLLPSIQYYLQNGEAHSTGQGDGELLPSGLATAFAALLRHYRVVSTEDGYWGESLSGERYLLRDDQALLNRLANEWALYNGAERSLENTIAAILSISELWDGDLGNEYPQLVQQLSSIISSWEVTL